MSGLKKAKNTISAILRVHPSIPTFHLAKLTYLFDLACVQFFGDIYTGLPYIWHYHGPYCKEFENALWDLELDGELIKKPHVTKSNHECTLHFPGKRRKDELPQEYLQILKYVVNEFAGKSTDELKEFVYATPPMKEAITRRKRFVRLDMMKRRREMKLPENEKKAVLKMLMNSKDEKKKKYISADESLKKLDEALAAVHK